MGLRLEAALGHAAPHRDAVLTALERVLAWPEMVRSPQLANFLDYIVRRKLDGQQQAIKAYSIAVDVFGRPADFDPQSDPIVRVQARRLRSLLAQYYLTDGQHDQVRISLPIGRYVPEFLLVAPEELAPIALPPIPPAKSIDAIRPQRRTLLIGLVLAGALLAITLITFLLMQQGIQAPHLLRRPSVTIVEFANLAEAEVEPPLVAGLAIELVTDLQQFENLDVRYGGMATENRQEESDFMLTGVVRRDGDRVQYSALLTDLRSDISVWDHTISVTSLEAHASPILDKLSQSLSMILGSARGPLHARAREMLSSIDAGSGPKSLYECHLRFDLYRETRDEAHAEQARVCLGILPEAERSNAIGLTLGGILKVAGIRYDAGEDARRLYDEAKAEVERALLAAPTSSFVWEQHGRLWDFMGEKAMAASDYSSAIQLNPANTDALAAYGRLLVFTGSIEEARPIVALALSGAPNPPPWYHGGPAMLAVLNRDWSRAVELAQIYEHADRSLGAALSLVAGQGAGNNEVINRYLPQVLDMPAFRSNGILARLRTSIIDPNLLDIIGQGLLAAGVPQNALEQPF